MAPQRLFSKAIKAASMFEKNKDIQKLGQKLQPLGKQIARGAMQTEKIASKLEGVPVVGGVASKVADVAQGVGTIASARGKPQQVLQKLAKGGQQIANAF